LTVAVTSSLRNLPDPEFVFPHCYKFLGNEEKLKLSAACSDGDVERLFECLQDIAVRGNLPPFFSELAAVEKAFWKAKNHPVSPSRSKKTKRVNPSLQLIRLKWGLSSFWKKTPDHSPSIPKKEEWIMIWRKPGESEVRLEIAAPHHLAALKVAADTRSPLAIAEQEGVAPGKISKAMRQAELDGVVLTSSKPLRREGPAYAGRSLSAAFTTAFVFALQWHITHACDLHCKHCYDRTQRSSLRREDALRVMDDLFMFCYQRSIDGHITFTGGHPFLHPDFPFIYKAAAERGFALSILGNPVSREALAELIAIQPPDYYQVSLEGLQPHNDAMRGQGHFLRTENFLMILKELKVESNVMLTLTKDNLKDVLPLAEYLRDRADAFTFNRISLVGEGANLALPEPREYKEFLAIYKQYAEKNPVMYFKDNLFNILRHREGKPLLGGCTGFGCGAAFNFVAVLPDGEVHACRKFPSRLGNILNQSLAEIYDSPAAHQYRRGSQACDACQIKHACGGCLAITRSCKLDISSEKDPFCFMDNGF
jgi:selenobiotic family peptide radical SAM maturase